MLWAAEDDEMDYPLRTTHVYKIKRALISLKETKKVISSPSRFSLNLDFTDNANYRPIKKSN